MKCPMCDGTGKSEIGVGAFTIHGADCDQCNGKGIIEPMTNEEYLRSCTTEQLAEFIYCLTEVCDYYTGNGAKKISQYAKEDANDKNHVELIHGNRDFDELVEWLKQPHQD